jgi:hypothetical protein
VDFLVALFTDFGDAFFFLGFRDAFLVAFWVAAAFWVALAFLVALLVAFLVAMARMIVAR